jgi:hypothetical protein
MGLTNWNSGLPALERNAPREAGAKIRTLEPISKTGPHVSLVSQLGSPGIGAPSLAG